MRSFICILLSIAPCLLQAQNYSTAAIPDSLRKGARVVVREHEVILEIKSSRRAVEKEHEVYTILSPNGDNLAGYFSYYDKFTDISSVSGILYDSLGKSVKKVKRKEMDDRGYEDGFSLATDARYLVHNFYCRTYPFTVEYQEEDDINGIRSFNDWLPLLNSGISTQHTKYVVIAPKDYSLRWVRSMAAKRP